MVPYISLYVVFVLLALGCSFYQKNDDKAKKKYVIIIGLAYAILCGCRASSVGYDTANYVQMFDVYADQSNMWTVYLSYLEPGYTLLTNIVLKLGGNVHTLFLICSVFISFSTFSFIRRYSKDFYFSIFVFLSFPYLLSSMDILRFFLGVSIWLWAVKFAIKRKWVRYVMITLLAAQFHKMIYIFLPCYFFTRLKWEKISFSIAGAITAVFFFAPTAVTGFVSSLMGRYDTYSSANAWTGTFSGGIKTAIMYVIIYGIYIIMSKRNIVTYTTEEEFEKNFFHSSMVVLLMSSIAFTNMGLMVRAILAMQPFMAVSLGNAFGIYTEAQEDYASTKPFSTVPSMKAVLMVVCIVYFGFLMWSNWGNVVPYVPFWME